MDWAKDGPTWPNQDSSRFVDARPHQWHVQVAGEGSDLLLLHGAGGATQSWRGLFPLLRPKYRVIAPDLPGQGFSKLSSRTRAGLRAMTEDLGTLLDQERWAPKIIVGHSAGAVLGLNLALERDVGAVIGLNAALAPFDGVAGWLFPVLAKLLALNPFVPAMFARAAGTERGAERLIASTGSTLDPLGLALYRRLLADPAHVDGALAMMAAWNIDHLMTRLGAIGGRVLLLTGDADLTVPPSVSVDVATAYPQIVHESLPGLGHLAHEEAPETVAAAIERFLAA